MQEEQIRGFNIKDKLSYLAGSMGNDLTFILAAVYLLKFYTDVMGMSAAIVGTMMMVTKFIDAVTDVAMGQIVDRASKKSKGKFLPFLKKGAGPMAIVSFLMYPVWFQEMGMGFKIGWMCITYLLWGSVCYTAVSIPYGAMASIITDKPKERAMLSNWRAIGSQISAISIGVILPMCIYYKNQTGQVVLSGKKFCIMAGIISLLAYSLFMICYHMTVERVQVTSKSEKFDLGKLVKGLTKNKALMGMMIASTLLFVAQLSASNMQSYIYPNYFGSSVAFTIANLVAIVATLSCSVYIVVLSEKLGRKKLIIIGAAVQVITHVILFVLKTQNVFIWIVLDTIGTMGTGVISFIMWAMLTDVSDDTEVITGERADGTIYALNSFARKFGQAIAVGLTGIMLSLVGYTVPTAFEPQVVKGIYNITCLVPIVTYGGVVLVIACLYPLNKARVEANTAELRKRHAVEVDV